MTNDRGLCHPCSAATPRESPNAGDATLNVGFECAGCIHGGRRNHRAATRTTNKERNQGHDSVNARSPMASATDQTAAPYLHIGAVTDSGNLVDTDSIEVECIVSNGQLVSMRRRQLFDALHSGVATLDVLPATLDNAVCTTSRDTDNAAQVQELNASGNGAGAAGSSQGNVMPEQSPCGPWRRTVVPTIWTGTHLPHGVTLHAHRQHRGTIHRGSTVTVTASTLVRGSQARDCASDAIRTPALVLSNYDTASVPPDKGGSNAM